MISHIRAAMRSKRGSVAVMFAIMLPVVVGFAGFGVETSYWYIKKLELQSQADAAAYAGAMEKRSGSSTSLVTTVASKGATDNGFDTSVGTITVNTPPASGSAGANAVEVIMSSQAQRFFTAAFFSGTVNLNARAVASYNTAANACILALNGTASKAALFSGNSSLTLSG